MACLRNDITELIGSAMWRESSAAKVMKSLKKGYKKKIPFIFAVTSRCNIRRVFFINNLVRDKPEECFPKHIRVRFQVGR